MDKLKAFLLGTLKIAVALFLVVVALIGVFAGWNSYQENQQKALNAPLAETKTWPLIKIDVFEDAQFRLVTMWRDSRLYYQLNVKGYPKSIESARRKLGTSKFTISFLDSSGFKIFSHEVNLATMAMEVDSKGEGGGLSVNDNTHISAEDYRRAAKWEVSWNFPTTVELPPSKRVEGSPAAKPKPAGPKWRNVELWRKLNREMSKQDVQQLLGPPTKIDDAGVLVFWYYGYPTGGQVTFNKSGAIHGWREPF